MADGDDGATDRRALEAPLLDVDSELNIFALANGLDLLKNRSDAPDRVLEWYRDGMERRIRIRAEGPGRFSVTAGASRKREGVVREAYRPVRAEMGTEELKGELRDLLAEGIETANALAEDDLSEP